ncbi:MAG TPA: ABC transporter permease, partial [Salinivirgaceae bacterium]|nr:ABC transporter permease [Salinivirgaceae bacterium]
QVVVGKFLSTLLLIAIALGLTFPYYITVANLGNIDHGAVISGYFGLLLMSAAYISIGLFASSITNNQIVAFLITLFIGIFFHLICGVLGVSLSGWFSSLFNYLSIQTHFNSIARGVVDTRNLVYFISLTLAGLTATEAVLTKRNLSE